MLTVWKSGSNEAGVENEVKSSNHKHTGEQLCVQYMHTVYSTADHSLRMKDNQTNGNKNKNA